MDTSAWMLSITRSFFFFQAEDGIRDYKVTGVQTCALPISAGADAGHRPGGGGDLRLPAQRLGHADTELCRAAVADRHLRRDVPGRFFHQQPHADGADDLHRLRGGRCHRDDREHRALRGKGRAAHADRKSTRLNSSHLVISYAVFCLKKKITGIAPSMQNATITYRQYISAVQVYLVDNFGKH